MNLLPLHEENFNQMVDADIRFATIYAETERGLAKSFGTRYQRLDFPSLAATGVTHEQPGAQHGFDVICIHHCRIPCFGKMVHTPAVRPFEREGLVAGIANEAISRPGIDFLGGGGGRRPC
ncbi:MAG: hypothetical protein RugAbin2_02246 [Rugosibacter sp.]|jgi:hypothetical protein|nr:hypothetical protein [Rugosibacter sp.]